MTVDRVLVREFFRFGVVGVAGMFVDVGALWVAINWLHAGYYLGRVFSYLCAATFTWAFNRRFTFQAAAQGPLARQWFHYLVVNAAGAFVNLGVYTLIVAFGPRLGVAPAKLAPYLPYLADALGGLAGMVFNFTGSKLFIFRAQSSSAP